MSEIEQKALALVNAVGVYHYPSLGAASLSDLRKALCRTIEQHEAFRQEVSDAVEAYFDEDYRRKQGRLVDALARFIIAKPDPLVEAMEEASGTNDPVEWANRFYAAIEKRGGKIVWGEG